MLVGLSLAAQLPAGASPIILADSGWLMTQPANRSISVLGCDLITFSDALNQDPSGTSRWPLYLAYMAEFTAGTQYLTAIHELGHARIVSMLGGQSHFDGQCSSWLTYVTQHRLFRCGTTYWVLPATPSPQRHVMLAAAGINAETYFSEESAQQPVTVANLLFSVPARLAATTYRVGGALSDLTAMARDYHSMGWRLGSDELRAWQLLALAGSATVLRPVASLFGHDLPFWWPEAFAYYNAPGVSLRLRFHWETNSGLQFSLSPEIIVHGKPEGDMQIGLSTEAGQGRILRMVVVASPHGLGGSVSCGQQFGSMTVRIGAEMCNPRTLSGAREAGSFRRTTIEPWLQIGRRL